MALSWDSNCVETRKALRQMQRAMWAVPDKLFTMSGDEVLRMEKSRKSRPLAVRHKALTEKDQGILFAKLNNRRHVLCARRQDAVASCLQHEACHIRECSYHPHHGANSPTCTTVPAHSYPVHARTCVHVTHMCEKPAAGDYPAADVYDSVTHNSTDAPDPMHPSYDEYCQCHCVRTHCCTTERCSMQHTIPISQHKPATVSNVPSCNAVYVYRDDSPTADRATHRRVVKYRGTLHRSPTYPRSRLHQSRMAGPQLRAEPFSPEAEPRKEEYHRNDCYRTSPTTHTNCHKCVPRPSQQSLKASLRVAAPTMHQSPSNAGQSSVFCRLEKKVVPTPVPHSPSSLFSCEPRGHNPLLNTVLTLQGVSRRVPATPSHHRMTTVTPPSSDPSPQPPLATNNEMTEPAVSSKDIQHPQQRCPRASRAPHNNSDAGDAIAQMATYNKSLINACERHCESRDDPTASVLLSPTRHSRMQPEALPVNESAQTVSPTRLSREQARQLPVHDSALTTTTSPTRHSRVRPQPLLVDDSAHMTTMSPTQHSGVQPRPLPVDDFAHTTKMSPTQHSRVLSRPQPVGDSARTTTMSALHPRVTTCAVLFPPSRATALANPAFPTTGPTREFDVSPLLQEMRQERGEWQHTINGTSAGHDPVLAPPYLARCGIDHGRPSSGQCVMEEHGGQVRDVPKSKER
eukprot:GEMP01012476.1.p1 GENE.GEMP01012476.1~~GEMP01012476.1.p1  ORF type:complete len:686 (-),score=116.83 GEMP01012476.1:975-3032(-)